MATQNTQGAGASKSGLEDLEAPARELTAEEAQKIEGGGGLIIDAQGDTSGETDARGVVLHDAKKGVVLHD